MSGSTDCISSSARRTDARPTSWPSASPARCTVSTRSKDCRRTGSAPPSKGCSTATVSFRRSNNVELHKGWFDDSLPAFIGAHPERVAFVHIDCDLYSSTKTVFDNLAPRLVPGSVIVFGEYFNYPGWEHHEFRAFQELVRDQHMTYEYLGYSARFHVAIRIQDCIRVNEPVAADAAPRTAA